MASHATDVHQLPPELLLLVFSYLNQSDLTRIMPVCHVWRYLADDPSFWKTLSLPFPNPKRIDATHPLVCSSNTFSRKKQWLLPVTKDAYATLLQRCCHVLEKLVFHYVWGSDWCFDPPIRLPRVTYLSFCTDLAITKDLLDKIVTCCPAVQVAHLYAERIDRDVVLDDVSDWTRLIECHVITLDIFTGSSRNCLTQADNLLMALAQRCPQLASVHISLTHSPLTDRGVHELCTLRSDTLTSLTLHSDRITDQSIAFLSRCQKLTHLKLFRCRRLTSKGLRQLASLPQLKELLLEEMDHLTESEFDTWMGRLRHLERLHVSAMIVSLSSYEKLGKTNPRLHTLELFTPYFRDYALPLLDYFPNLRQLDVVIIFAEFKADWVLPALTAYPALRRVRISCQTGEANIETLLPTLPIPEGWKMQHRYNALDHAWICWFTKGHWPMPAPLSTPCTSVTWF